MMKRFLYCVILLCFIRRNVIGQELPYIQYSVQDGLGSMFVRCIFQDSRGIIWVGTLDGLSKFGGQSFVNYNKSTGLETSIINSISEDIYGNLLLSTGGARANILYKFDGIKFSRINVFTNPERIQQLISGNNGKVYINTISQVIVYNTRENCFDLLELPWKTENCNVIQYDTNTDYLYAFVDDKLLYYTGNNNCWKPIVKKDTSLKWKDLNIDYSAKNVISNSNLGSFIMNKDDYYFISKEKLVAIDYSTNQYIKSNRKILIKDNNIYKIINNDNEPFIFIDMQNNIWTYSLHGLRKTFFSPFENYPDSIRNVWQPFKDKRNNLYLLGYEEEPLVYDGNNYYNFRYIMKLNNINGSYYHGFSLKSPDSFYLSGTSCLQLFQPPNRLSIVTEGNSLFNYYDIKKDYILTASCPGVKIIDSKNNNIVKEVKNMHNHYCIVSICSDSLGNYWFGSYKGLSKFNLSNDSIYNYELRNNTFPEEGVISLAKDLKGILWLGTTSGLYKLICKTSNFVKVSGELINSHVNFLQPVGDSLLIIGVIDGIYVLNLRKYNNSNSADFKYFNNLNGYQGDEPRQNGKFLDQFGKLYIGSNTKLSVLDVNKIDWNMEPHKLFISEVNLEKVSINQQFDKIILTKEENYLNISFDLICNIPEKDRMISFFLEGHDLDWKPWQSNMSVQYNNLKSGNYNLQIWLKEISGNKRGKLIKSIPIIVTYPFYKDSSFVFYLILMLLLLAVLLIALWNYKTIKIKNLIVAKSEIDNKFLRNQMLYSQLNPHFIFNVLTSIQNLLSKENTKEANKHILNLAKLMRRFLDSSIKSDVTSKIGDDHLVQLSSELELVNLYVEFEQLQFPDKFDYKIEIDSRVDIDDIKIPPMIIQPFVENSIKHGIFNLKIKGTLILKANLLSDEELEILIDDNGIGRQKAQELNKFKIKAYKSYGTKLVENRVEILKSLGEFIEIETIDKKEGGTLVRIRFYI